jgi:hypothetical protein
MNWYKKSQQFKELEDLVYDVDDEYRQILTEYYDRKRKREQMMSWKVIPFSRLKKIWEDYSKYGVVRDTKGMDSIVEDMLHNLSRLQAATQLAGHTQIDSKERAKEMGLRHPHPKNWNFYCKFLETPYGTPISDFGLDKLWKLADQLLHAPTYENKLLIVDQMLNVVHQRGDLAALFIEGGINSLNDLKGPDELV